VDGGFRIHLNGDGQTMAPWFAVTAVQQLMLRKPGPGYPAPRRPR